MLIAMSAARTVFISYSRRDFGFAEAISAALADRAWLDVNRLAPGQDWQGEIRRAIDDSDAVLLLASRSALASKYVTEEWKHALAQGKPVEVCLIEAVELPEELAGCTLHDLRRTFWRRVTAIADGRHTAPVGVRLPRLNLVPAPVATLIAAMVVGGLALLWAAWIDWQVRTTLHDDGWSGDIVLSGMALMATIAFAATGISVLVAAVWVPWRRSSGSMLNYHLGFVAIWGFTQLMFTMDFSG